MSHADNMTLFRLSLGPVLLRALGVFFKSWKTSKWSFPSGSSHG